MRLGLIAALVGLGFVACVGDDPAASTSSSDGGTTDAQAGGGDGGADATPAAPFSLAVSPATVIVKPGGNVTFTVTSTAPSSFSGAIAITVTGLPAGVSAAAATIAQGQTQVIVTLTATTAAAAGSVAATVIGTNDGESSQTNLTVSVAGQNGAVDTSFGTSGIFTTTDGDGYVDDSGSCTAGEAPIVVQSDGKIVLGVTIAKGSSEYVELIRLTADGALDPSFGASGKTDYTKLQGLLGAIAIDASGNIVAAGETTGGGVLVARYTSAGVLDTTFNGTGYNALPPPSGGSGCANGVAIRTTDNAIVTTGEFLDSESFTALAFSSTGAQITSGFGSGGRVDYTGSDSAYAYASVMNPSTGDVYMGGNSQLPVTPVVFSFTTTGASPGTANTSFYPTTGAETFSFTTVNGITAMVLGSSTNIITASAQTGVGLRIDDIGLNYSTAVNSTTMLALSTTKADEAGGIAIQLDGNYVVAGQHGDTSTAIVGRVHSTLSNGIDTAFGKSGWVDSVFGTANNPSRASAIAVASDGRILVVGMGKIGAGSISGTSYGTLFVTRLWP
jgi:uncharacterized delta-60 repeat protein